jgi:hypothetical protein
MTSSHTAVSIGFTMEVLEVEEGDVAKVFLEISGVLEPTGSDIWLTISTQDDSATGNALQLNIWSLQCR